MKIFLYKKKVSLVLVLLIYTLSSFAQNLGQELYFGPSCAEQIKHEDRGALFGSLKNFLNGINGDSPDTTSSINRDYLKIDKNPFPYLTDVQKSGKFNDRSFFKPVISYVIAREKNEYLVKISFLGTDPSSKTPILRMVHTLYAKPSGTGYQFYNPGIVYAKEWKTIRLGNVIYHYRDKFDRKKARKMSRFNAAFSKKLETKEIEINYFKCRDPREMFYILGCDYTINAYFANTGGLAQHWNNSIFAANNSEYYPHELVHLYIYQKFGTSVNHIADEGYATLIGGSGERPLNLLVSDLKNFINKNHDSNILDLFLADYQIDGKTSFMYTLSGFLLQEIEKIHGQKGIEELISADNNIESYFKVLNKLTGINKSNFNQKIKHLIGIDDD